MLIIFLRFFTEYQKNYKNSGGVNEPCFRWWSWQHMRNYNWDNFIRSIFLSTWRNTLLFQKMAKNKLTGASRVSWHVPLVILCSTWNNRWRSSLLSRNHAIWSAASLQRSQRIIYGNYHFEMMRSFNEAFVPNYTPKNEISIIWVIYLIIFTIVHCITITGKK